MSIGNFGNLVFQVSKKKLYGFYNFKRTRKASWKEHNRYNNKPTSEFAGLELDTISFEIYLDASLGVNPRKEIEKWGKALESGKHDVLVIGGKQVGKYDWKIESISEDWKTLLNKGELTTATLSISLSEYVTITEAKKKNTTTNKTNATTSNKVSVSSLKKGGSYKVITQLTGYYTALEAKNQQATNRTGKVYPGTYYIFNISSGMINVTKVKGSPGSWINPGKNK